MSVLVLGTFDGVHKAHKALVSAAKSSGENVIVCSFDVPPALFFKKINGVLSLENEKEFLLKSVGADRVFSEKFSDTLANISPEDYIKSLVEKFHPSAIYSGYNHKFGKNASGNCGTLSMLGEKYGFRVNILPPFSVDGCPVSSTAIRNLICSGDMLSAKKLLGRYYSVFGKTVHGKQLGRTIGFPTVNTLVPEIKLLPQAGVYATRCCFDGKYRKSMTNIGTNPTVDGKTLSVETHILGFNGDLYGKNIKIEFVRKIRDDIAFNSLDELKNQLSNDALLVDSYLQSTDL